MNTDTMTAASSMILLVGASRGLGYGMAVDLAQRGWNVVGTVRGRARTELHALAETHPGWLEVETLDITDPEAITALGGRLSGRYFDVLFVNAGTANRDQGESVADVSTGSSFA